MIEIIPMELTVRGKRINEPVYRDFPEAVNDMYERVDNDLNHESFAFFGHSLGAPIAYEVAQKLRKFRQDQLVHIFFSGK